MKKKIIWGVVSGWMVAALLLASCAPAVVEEAKKVAPPVQEEDPKEGVVPLAKVHELLKWTGGMLDEGRSR